MGSQWNCANATLKRYTDERWVRASESSLSTYIRILYVLYAEKRIFAWQLKRWIHQIDDIYPAWRITIIKIKRLFAVDLITTNGNMAIMLSNNEFCFGKFMNRINVVSYSVASNLTKYYIFYLSSSFQCWKYFFLFFPYVCVRCFWLLQINARRQCRCHEWYMHCTRTKLICAPIWSSDRRLWASNAQPGRHTHTHKIACKPQTTCE